MTRTPARIDPAAAQKLTLGVRAVVLGNERYRRMLAEALGLGTSEIRTLSYLYRLGPLTPRVIAQQLGFGTGSTTAVLDKLEVIGHITRTPHPTDRRSLLISITESGRSAMGWIDSQTTDRISNALLGRPGVDIDELAALMTAIGDALGERPPEIEARP